MIPLNLSAACVCLYALIQPTGVFAQSPASPAQWHVGTFTGQVVSGTERMVITVTCVSEKVCEYTFESQPPVPGQSSRSRTDNIQVIEVTVPNNNLKHTKEAVSANADLYSQESDGPLLQELRPLLESQAAFGKCVGVSELAGAWGRVCEVTPQGKHLPEAALLIPTMNPTCGSQPFCAYYIFVLQRSGPRRGG